VYSHSLVAGLRELGYAEGQNIVIERVFEKSDRIDFANLLPN